MREAARATTAGQYTHTPPMLVKHSTTEFEFRDPGILGFNNPTHLARREASRLWKGAQIGAIVSVGTGLVALTSPTSTSALESAFEKSPPEITTREMHFKSILKRLSLNAVDSERVHDATFEELTYGCACFASVIPRIDLSLLQRHILSPQPFGWFQCGRFA